jgi:hypothetical protein
LPVRVDEASDEEFDTFIREFIELGWTLEERIDALIDALQDGQQIPFVQPVGAIEPQEKIG